MAGAATGQSQQFNNLATQNAQNNPSVAPTNGQYQLNSMNPGAYTQPQQTVQQQPPNINTLAAQGVVGAGAATTNEMGYTPSQVQSGQLANTNMAQYMNPYTDQVIKANETDILRGANKGLDMLGAQATAAQAFGGSRHGVAMGELGRDVASQLAQSSANLRQQGYTQAGQAAQSDIANRMNADQFNVQSGMQGSQNRLGAANQLGALSNLGFGMGQTVNQNLMQQGGQQQAMNQALIDAGKSNFAGYTGQPQNSLGYVSQALGATPVPQTQTTSKQPGLFDYMTLAATAYASDKRLKKNLTKMGQLKSGLNIYKWEWKEGAEKFGADMNHTMGVIAQEAKELFPNAVVKMDNGYYAVKYGELR